MMTLSKSKWLFASRFKLRIAGLLTLSLVGMPAPLIAQQNNKYTVEPTKFADDKAKTAKEKEKNAELKGDKTDLTAFTEFYTGYIIPKLTEATPTELNARRRDVEADMEAAGKNKSKAVQAAFNKKVYELFSNVAKNPPGKSYNPGTRITAMILLTQLTRDAGKNPAVSDPDVLRDLYVVLDPKRLSDPKTREMDAMLFIAIKSLEKYLRGQPANPADGFPDRLRKAFVARIAEHMTMDPPVPRLPDAHQKMMEQALLTMTLFATKNSGETPKGTVSETQKAATETVTKFVVKVFNDERSSEWLKEIACACLGQISPTALTPEEATKLENEIAKFAIKSLKDWRVKIAMSGSLAAGGMMGGYGSGGMGGGVGGIPGGSGEGGSGEGGYGGGMGSEGGYGMGSGQSNPAANRNVFDKQPPEVKNARRMIHQRLERIHLGLNGSPRKYPDSSPLAKNGEKGLVTLVADGEKDKIRDAVEKLDKLQTDVNSNQVLDLAALSNVIRVNLKEFRLACVAISGEEKEEAEMDAANPFGSSGASE